MTMSMRTLVLILALLATLGHFASAKKSPARGRVANGAGRVVNAAGRLRGKGPGKGTAVSGEVVNVAKGPFGKGPDKGTAVSGEVVNARPVKPDVIDELFGGQVCPHIRPSPSPAVSGDVVNARPVKPDVVDELFHRSECPSLRPSPSPAVSGEVVNAQPFKPEDVVDELFGGQVCPHIRPSPSPSPSGMTHRSSGTAKFLNTAKAFLKEIESHGSPIYLEDVKLQSAKIECLGKVHDAVSCTLDEAAKLLKVRLAMKGEECLEQYKAMERRHRKSQLALDRSIKGLFQEVARLAEMHTTATHRLDSLGYDHHDGGVSGYDHHDGGVSAYDHHDGGVSGYDHHDGSVSGYDHHNGSVSGYDHHDGSISCKVDTDSGVEELRKQQDCARHLLDEALAKLLAMHASAC